LIASLFAIFYIYQLALILFSKQEAELAAIIFAAMPYLNFMSFFFNREILVIALMIYLTYALIFFLTANRFKSKFLFFAVLCCTALLRPENLVFMGVYLGIILMLYLCHQRGGFRIRVTKYGFYMVLTLVTAGLLYAILSDIQLLKIFHLKDFSPQAFYQKAQRHIHFGLAYLPRIEPKSWLGLTFLYGPQQAINFLMRPFPWEIFRFNQIFLVVNNIALYFLYLASLIGLLKLSRREPITLFIAVLLFLIIGILPASLIQGNAFAAARHREQMIFFIYILGAGGIMTLIKSSSRKALK
jgi:hypothetical protein